SCIILHTVASVSSSSFSAGKISLARSVFAALEFQKFEYTVGFLKMNIGFYGCYLLVSESEKPLYQGKCYVGFTVNPERRIKQHNRGSRYGGAWRTSNRGPWEMVLVVHGFPNEICALRFEWAWQHPNRSRRLRVLNLRKRQKESALDYHIKILSQMLNVGPWNRLPLTVRWLCEKYETMLKNTIVTPPHIEVISGPLNIGDRSEVENCDFTLSDACKLCYNSVMQGSLLTCVDQRCRANFHIICLANEFRKSEAQFVIPVIGVCPNSGLTSLIQGYFPNTRVHGCYFHFSKAVHRKVGELELNRNRRKNIRMLLATVFLPVPQVDTGVSLLEAGSTGPLAALFQYFWQEWMSDERPPHWNVRDVSLRTNSHLEGLHNRLNRKADKSHNGFYELLELLIAEQGVMDTLIQQVLSGNVTVGDLRRVNKVYAQKQRQVAQYTGEYTNGRRTLEQFLEALMYITPEPI
ncbi:Structure-specific endonuclease subunit SLX1 -like protein, partial [Trichinella nativa]